MANVTQRDPTRPGVSGPSRLASDETPRDGQADEPGQAHANETRVDMKRMAEDNAQLLENLRARAETNDNSELAALREQNAELRRKIAEREQGPEGAEADWAEKQREYEALLEEKSEVIRGLHIKIQQLQESGAAGPQEATTAEATTASVGDVLELQRQLEDERRQLKDDEESLMAQMREKDMAMSRDRAELARHRTELQRLHADLNRELENASRDGGLRERLLALTRKQPDGGKSSLKTTQMMPTIKTPATEAAPTDNKKQGSGFFRRMFGG